MEKKPFIPKEGKGRLFQNTRREGRQPNWRGDAMVNGVHVQISGWDNDDGSISLSIQNKGEMGERFNNVRKSVDSSAPASSPANGPVDGENIPF